MKQKCRVSLAVLLAGLAVVLAGGAAWARNAPAFSLPDADGKEVALSTFRGKYVVVDFIQTTCPHCRAAGEVLEKMYAENRGRLMVISISDPSTAIPAMRQYVQEHRITYPVLLGDMKAYVDYLGVSPQKPSVSVPVFFFIGPSGEILEERNLERASDKDWFANMEQNLEASIKKMLPVKPAENSRKTGGAAKKRPAVKKQP
jgi:peroxiredoxin